MRFRKAQGGVFAKTMITKLLGMFAMAGALGVISWHPSFDKQKCCPPAAPQDVIQFYKLKSNSTEGSNWLQVLTHEESSIRAYASGTVIRVEEDSSLGNVLVVVHNTGKQSVYRHLDDIHVNLGETVTQGQSLGTPKVDPTFLTARFDFSVLPSSRDIEAVVEI